MSVPGSLLAFRLFLIGKKEWGAKESQTCFLNLPFFPHGFLTYSISQQWLPVEISQAQRKRESCIESGLLGFMKSQIYCSMERHFQKDQKSLIPLRPPAKWVCTSESLSVIHKGLEDSQKCSLIHWYSLQKDESSDMLCRPAQYLFVWHSKNSRYSKVPRFVLSLFQSVKCNRCFLWLLLMIRITNGTQTTEVTNDAVVYWVYPFDLWRAKRVKPWSVRAVPTLSTPVEEHCLLF